MDYITTADVNALLGENWAPDAQKPRAVMMANAWLTERIRRDVPTPIPSAIKQAGAEIARDSAAGKVFEDESREVSQSTVSAGGGVSVSKTFAAGSRARTQGESLAMTLIAPWRRRAGVFMLERI